MIEDSTTPQPHTPAYVTVASACGISAAVFSGVTGLYFALVFAGTVPAPTAGFGSLCAMVITILSVVKIAQVMADKAEDRTRALLRELHAGLVERLDRVSDSALEAAHNSGRWEGVATAFRSAEDGAGDVVPFAGRRGSRNG